MLLPCQGLPAGTGWSPSLSQSRAGSRLPAAHFSCPGLWLLPMSSEGLTQRKPYRWSNVWGEGRHLPRHRAEMSAAECLSLSLHTNPTFPCFRSASPSSSHVAFFLPHPARLHTVLPVSSPVLPRHRGPGEMPSSKPSRGPPFSLGPSLSNPTKLPPGAGEGTGQGFAQPVTHLCCFCLRSLMHHEPLRHDGGTLPLFCSNSAR